MAPSIVNGVLASVSPTQIKQYEGCALQWYLQRVVGLPMPQTASQGLGESIHAQVEKYLLEGVQPEHESIRSAIREGFVPSPNDRLVVEEPRNYDLKITAAGVPVKGRIDLLIPAGVVGPHVDVVDWKSASSWRYLHTPESLARDAQGTIYLHHAFSKFPWAKTGRFSHVYLRTKGGSGAKAVRTDPLTVDEVGGMYAHLETIVAEMKDCARIESPADVPYKLETCDKYGGCAFRAECPAQNRSLVQLMRETESTPTITEDPMTLSERLKARRSATMTPPTLPESEPSATPAPVPAVAEPSVTPAPAPAAVGVIPPDAPKVEGKVLPPKPKNEVEVAFVPSPAPAPEPAPAPALTLYVDCIPEKGEAAFTLLEDDIAARAPSLLEHLRKTRTKEVPEGAVDLGEVAFGGGYAALVASYVVKPLTGVVVASSHGSASSRVLEVLVPRAAKVVRARR